MNFEISVLGSGAGDSAVYNALPSSGFMLLADGQPFCLVDLGLGVGQQVLEAFGGFPKQIIITHNHSDHAGELPVVLRVEQAQGRKLEVISHCEVAEQLKLHRVAEHLQLITADELADWRSPETAETIDLAHGLDITFYPGSHSEFSCGFLVRRDGEPLLSYSGDTTLVPELYTLLDEAEVFIMDARPKPNRWHASFEDVKPWLDRGRYILGHGLNEQNAKQYKQDGWPLLWQGDRIAFGN
ncbi:MBL fold metallo-hydrolase [Thiomicrorhabdus sp. ZW0627]|uniref:MBL fold metallo-hydrolase n=1 Tax=Thiomicrorhabdus sp. ZW0627 TaxID=3039774 RepID=UPI002437215E|nr:MBL fold metallo-hydrolase [Thiomicrorhabdus sp. ZW0627]MDG6772872.1 MBL fold metallo-hydrolase [Thiomicrorhabdus sp. ZW0627]